MRALDRKLVRDLARMKAQVITIALVVGSGIASYLAAVTTYRSLVASRDAYYRQSLFADVFATVNRAPDALVARVREVPGVGTAEGRILSELRVQVPGFDEPVRAMFESLPPHPALNLLTLVSGRSPERDDEVVVSELFAKAHHLVPGVSTIDAAANGRSSRMRVVGIGISPEFVWVIPPGGLYTDDRRYGVCWMRHDALATVLQMRGSFNSLSVSLAPGASEPEVLAAVDRLLEPYGNHGAIGRDKQTSNRLVLRELNQLERSATLLPLIFLGVASFLLNVLLSRVVGTQREQIAALKALGYTNVRVAVHYVEMALAILALGTLFGAALGSWAGQWFVSIYTRYFRFPVLQYRFDLDVLFSSVAISSAGGLFGALWAVRNAARLAPAEAMRPEAPQLYRASFLERTGIERLLSTISRMVARDLERAPLRLLLSAAGIALATGILVVGNASFDAMDVMFAIQFEQAQREDLTVSFVRSLPARAVREIGRVPGVLSTEGLRIVPARVRAGTRWREVGLSALPDGLTLRQELDLHGRALRVPASGLAISATLADILRVRPGDEVEVELLEGERHRRRIPVAALVDDLIGLTAVMREPAFCSAFSEPPLYSQALAKVDPAQVDALLLRLTRLPLVASVSRREVERDTFRKQITDVFLTFQLILAGFATIIAVGVVYNNARIALVLRSRDLATLRILGFTRAEVGNVLLGEQAAQLLLGIPVGFPIGRRLALALLNTGDPELFRFPVVVSGRTYAFATLVVLTAGLVSAVLVRRRANQLNLISTLKARD